jgi:hypothetical protein
VVQAAFKALDRVVLKSGAWDPSNPTALFDLEATKEELDEKQRGGDIIQSVKALMTVADGLVRTVIGGVRLKWHQISAKLKFKLKTSPTKRTS